ncbi:MAG: N-acetyl-gamma-glutamyl-phosphate reductase [Pelagibacterales bacterium]|nr:N-acetyl-gamma-glutamyl-phosphate reductase [Pelagibacterales bacterium]
MSLKKINVAIAGATGYVGLDLIYLISKHPKVNIISLCAQKNLGKNIQFFDKRIKKKLPKIGSLKNVNWKKIDLLFLSLPNGEAQKLITRLSCLRNLKFIDLSADFRIEDKNLYKNWYNINHNASKLINKSIYSISEFVKKKINNYKIISNPGCYPTSIQLPLIPLIKKRLIRLDNIIIDSKSGYSGAGKNYKKKFQHKHIEQNIHAYGIKKHRHMSELDQEFNKITKHKIQYTFNPHLLPMFRGILSSIYLETKKDINIKKIYSELKKSHKKNYFIKILPINSQLGTSNVLNTNCCEISVCETRYKNRIVIFSALDNLIKGASGQAIQNMNLLFNLRENLGLKR